MKNRTIIFNKRPIRILTNDPSFTAWGWVVVELDNSIISKGVIKTEPASKKMKIRKGDSNTQRMREISQKLVRVIKAYNVKFIVSELPHGSQNANAAIMMGAVAGILIGICESLRIPIEWFYESDAKRCLFGKQSVSKQETIDLIEQEFNVDWYDVKYKDEAIADALAIYATACRESTNLQILKVKQ